MSQEPRGVGVSELAMRVRIPVGSVHRLLTAAAAFNYVRQHPGTRCYRLGPSVLRLQQAYLRQLDIAADSDPVLRDLSTRTGETTFLTVLDGYDAICVATVTSSRPLRLFMRIGQRMPYHCAASAQAILAFQPDTWVTRVLDSEPLVQFTSRSPGTVEEIRRRLQAVRTQGYAVCEEEMEEGITALAAPIRNALCDVVASVTVIGPSERFAGARRPAIIRELLQAAETLSRMMGCEGTVRRTSERER